jgi:hypothetical protein
MSEQQHKRRKVDVAEWGRDIQAKAANATLPIHIVLNDGGFNGFLSYMKKSHTDRPDLLPYAHEICRYIVQNIQPCQYQNLKFMIQKDAATIAIVGPYRGKAYIKLLKHAKGDDRIDLIEDALDDHTIQHGDRLQLTLLHNQLGDVTPIRIQIPNFATETLKVGSCYKKDPNTKRILVDDKTVENYCMDKFQREGYTVLRGERHFFHHLAVCIHGAGTISQLATHDYQLPLDYTFVPSALYNDEAAFRCIVDSLSDEFLVFALNHLDVCLFGFPDLILRKDGVTSFIEVKSEQDTMSPHQTWWGGYLVEQNYGFSIQRVCQ